jgi:hypothetical protein
MRVPLDEFTWIAIIHLQRIRLAGLWSDLSVFFFSRVLPLEEGQWEGKGAGVHSKSRQVMPNGNVSKPAEL